MREIAENPAIYVANASAVAAPESSPAGRFLLPPAASAILRSRCRAGNEWNMTMEKVPMTANGHSMLEAELRRRQAEDRPAIIRAIAEARGHGDLSENAEYHAAKEQQGHNEGRIAELEDMLSRAEVIDITKLSGKTVKFGATVKLVDEDTEETRTYQIVGEQEADVKSGKISITSPIARAMIGKGKGDTVDVSAPGGSKSYEILAVKFA
jgi:transcription elongation factor GreA